MLPARLTAATNSGHAIDPRLSHTISSQLARCSQDTKSRQLARIASFGYGLDALSTARAFCVAVAEPMPTVLACSPPAVPQVVSVVTSVMSENEIPRVKLRVFI